MNLMMTKDEIVQAVEQYKKIEKIYPEAFKLYLMLMALSEIDEGKINFNSKVK